MTIQILDGDIFASGAAALVCPVNCVGVMGAGLAKAFKARYPKASAQSIRKCESGHASPGTVHTFAELNRDAEGELVRDKLIHFAATKDHWRYPSYLSWVTVCAENLVYQTTRAFRTESIAIPALGVGCGGLAWDDVRPVLVEAADRIEAAGVRVMLYGPKEVR